MVVSLFERFFRSSKFSFCVGVRYFKNFKAKLPYSASDDPWNGVPRKRVPIARSAISLEALASSVL